MHIERIDPSEKIDPSLGGTGYLLPQEPASTAELLADAMDRAQQPLKITVWKVARASVKWHRHQARRMLHIEKYRIPCKVLGSERHWYFVAVDAPTAVERLTARKD